MIRLQRSSPRASKNFAATFGFSFAISKKSFFFTPSYDEYMKIAGKLGSVKAIAEYVCSHCAIIPCTNRLAPFYDKKIFKKLLKKPDPNLLKR